jgi:sporulation protein YlmC with PRC-barrel domain
MRARELKGRSVLDVVEARQVAKVEAVVVDPEVRRVIALRVEGDRPLLPIESVRALGPDAVTVEGADVLRLPQPGVEQRAVDESLDPLGRLVLADDGTELGTVDDLEADDDGTLRSLTVAGDSVAGDRLLGIGAYAVVVRA